jgi:hypothetical protein
MTDLDPVLRAELQGLRDRHAADGIAPRVTVDAIAEVLVRAGHDYDVAWRTAGRWLITRDTLDEALAVELDPPYDTSRSRPGTAGPGRG